MAPLQAAPCSMTVASVVMMVMVPVVMIVAVPVMVISRTVVVARVDAERAIHAANRTAYGAADDPSDGASDGTAFGRAALHSPENALSMSGHWRGEQRCHQAYSKRFPHCYFSILFATAGLTSTLPGSSRLARSSCRVPQTPLPGSCAPTPYTSGSEF
jgi:hypothetical protein